LTYVVVFKLTYIFSCLKSSVLSFSKVEKSKATQINSYKLQFLNLEIMRLTTLMIISV